MADEDLDLDTGEAPKSSMKMIILIGVAVALLLVVGVFAGMYFGGMFDDGPASEENVSENGEPAQAPADGGDEQAAAPPDAAKIGYWPLEPPFVLNFEGTSNARYMQIGLEVMAKNDQAIEAVKKHMPVIRNEVVLLLSGQRYEEMVTPEGKEQLRAELIETINNILKQFKSQGITNIYFTSFVMQ